MGLVGEEKALGVTQPAGVTASGFLIVGAEEDRVKFLQSIFW
jgi:hypothetical protein